MLITLSSALFLILGGDLPSTGECHDELKSFDRLLTKFMADNHVPGAALAVVKDGRLLLARGYGFANIESKEPVQPHSLFRIASVSKPLTAVAVLKLVEEGRLKLNDPVCTLLDLAKRAPDVSKFDPRWKKITVLDLLRHTGGFDRDRSFDPMFRSVEFANELKQTPPASQDVIIRAMLSRPLDFDPGERYAYSNFGYCLLGRVVENAAGVSYDEYVKKKILEPIGVRNVQIGKTAEAGRAKEEVHYYAHGDQMGSSVVGKIGEQVPVQYGGFCIESMDSHGGWIASAVDLARFSAALDSGKLLSKTSMETLAACPPGVAGHDATGKALASWYGCGFSIRPVGKTGRSSQWHTGLLAGTSTLLVRRFDGLDWVVLFNTDRGSKGNVLSGDIDGKLHAAAAEVKTWPEIDLFKKY